MYHISFLVYKHVEEERTQGNISTALLEDTAGSSTTDLGEVLADARNIGGLAAGLAGDGIVQAGESTAGDILSGLGLDGGSEGKGDKGVLHFGGLVCWVSKNEGYFVVVGLLERVIVLKTDLIF